jgi:hypothetical protein
MNGRITAWYLAMIINAADYRWRLPAFRAWLARHGVNLRDVLEIHIHEAKQTMTVHEFVRSADGFPLTNYRTMLPAEKLREIKLLSPVPK